MPDHTHSPATLSSAPTRIMGPLIVERLRLGFPEQHFGIERVPSTLTLSEFQRLTRVAPFIGLSWTGLQPDAGNARILRADMMWRLTLIVRNSQSAEGRFKGDQFDIGLDAMLDVATVLLQGAVFEDIGQCNVTSARPVYAEGHEDDAVALAHVDFTISFSAPLSGLQLKPGADLTALNVAWLTTDSDDPTAAPTVLQTIETAEENN